MCKHDEARGSLDVRKGFPFLPKKMKFAEFFSGKGKAWNKADNFCLIVRKHDEARGSLRMLPKKMKFTEFFSGKGKALNEVIFYKEKGGFLYAKNM